MCVEPIDECLSFDELCSSDTSYSTRIHTTWNGRDIHIPKERPSLRKVDFDIPSHTDAFKPRHYELITDHVAFNKNIFSKTARVVRHTGHNVGRAVKKHKKVIIVAAAVVAAVAITIATLGTAAPEAVAGVAAAAGAATASSEGSKKRNDKETLPPKGPEPPGPILAHPEPSSPWKPMYSFTEVTPQTPSSPPSFMDRALDDIKRTATHKTSQTVHASWDLVGKAEQELARAQDFIGSTFLNIPPTLEQEAKARTQEVHQKIDNSFDTQLAHTYEPGYHSPIAFTTGEIPLPFVPLPGRITQLTAIEANAARTGSLASEALKDIATAERSALVTQEGNIANLKPVGKLEGTANSTLSKAISQLESEAYLAAKNGGKHAPLIPQYSGKTVQEIQKGVKSYEKQIAIHKDKIANPSTYYPDWDKLDPRQQQSLIEVNWPAEIQCYTEQRDILQSILDLKQ